MFPEYLEKGYRFPGIGQIWTVDKNITSGRDVRWALYPKHRASGPYNMFTSVVQNSQAEWCESREIGLTVTFLSKTAHEDYFIDLVEINDVGANKYLDKWSDA